MISKQKYWYKIYIGECPVCMKDKSYRLRMYDKKPKNKNNRIIYLSDNQTYDHCDTKTTF